MRWRKKRYKLWIYSEKTWHCFGPVFCNFQVRITLTLVLFCKERKSHNLNTAQEVVDFWAWINRRASKAFFHGNSVSGNEYRSLNFHRSTDLFIVLIVLTVLTSTFSKKYFSVSSLSSPTPSLSLPHTKSQCEDSLCLSPSMQKVSELAGCKAH